MATNPRESLWRRFACDEAGATAIEFAVIMTLLFTFLFIIIEVSFIWMTSSMLENAMITASRYAKTNFNSPTAGVVTPDYDQCANLPRNEMVRCLVRRTGRGMIDADEISFNARVLGSEWSNANLGNTASGYGGKGDVVLYEAQYARPFINPLLWPFFPGGTYVIKASTLIQNEK